MFHRPVAVVMAVILVAGMTAGCAHNVKINSSPPGAACHVKDMYIGKTPAIYRAHSGVPSSIDVKLSMDGYKTINTKIRSHYNADLSLLWLIPGIVPYFVGTAEYNNQYTYKLRKK